MFFMLLLNQYLLLSLHSLVLHLLLRNQLDRQLTRLLYYPLILFFFCLARCWSPNKLIQNNAACIDVFSF